MIKWMSLMLFIFILGRGIGGDVFFSVYIDSIVSDPLLISLMAALLALSKIVFSLAV
jgi:hypothetical protein